MKNITVVTGTRAEYGLLKNIMKEIQKSESLDLKLIVTGTHLSRKYGYTIEEIERDGFKIDAKISILENGKENDTCLSSSKLLEKLGVYFRQLESDLILILGDRYEIFMVATVAMLMNIPIAHISGGEITEGAIDEKIRHSITKMANIHFPGANEYEENIRNMGEEKWRIFNVGDPGIENIKKTHLFNQKEIKEYLGVEVDKSTILVTFHPVTLEVKNTEKYIANLISALKRFENNIIITYPNSDTGSEIIIEKILEYEKENINVKVFKSLGIELYLSVMNECGVVVGNSSSGIVEAPYLKIPVVNIGNRQKGRLMANNIINCRCEIDDIYESIKKSLTREFEKFVEKNTKSLYGDGNTSNKIVSILEKLDINDKLLIKKLIWE